MISNKLLSAAAVAFALSSMPALAAGASVKGAVSGAVSGAVGTASGSVGAAANAGADADAALTANTRKGDASASGSASLSANLGIDISRAGDTSESREAFIAELNATDLATLQSHCANQTAMPTLTADEKAICEAATN
jgi:hypothetical protein